MDALLHAVCLSTPVDDHRAYSAKYYHAACITNNWQWGHTESDGSIDWFSIICISVVSGCERRYVKTGGNKFEQFHDTRIGDNHQLLGQRYEHGFERCEFNRNNYCCPRSGTCSRNAAGIAGDRQWSDRDVKCGRHGNGAVHLSVVSGSERGYVDTGGNQFQQFHDTRIDDNNQLLGAGQQQRGKCEQQYGG